LNPVLWYNGSMTQNSTSMTVPNRTRTRVSTDNLARLMATENISVQHQPVETASFNVKTRVLIMPRWDNMSQEVTDMLVAHEVSHALYTPAGEKPLMDAIKRIGDATGAPATIAKHLLNVVEDARIERMIKAKFPGSRRDFIKGYEWMNERDFFGIADKEIAELTLPDRINLHYKLGTINAVIPFAIDERIWLDRIDATESFDDVVDICEDLAALLKGEQEEQQEAGDGEDEDTNETGETGNGGAPGDESDEDTETGEAGDTTGGEDTGESMEDDTDDGESAEGEDGESSTQDGEESGNDQMDGDYDSEGQDHTGWEDAETTTQSKMEERLQGEANTHGRETNYVNMPRMNLDNIIVTPKTIAAAWESHDIPAADWDRIDQCVKAWDRENNPTINNMLKRFEMKRAADASRRTFSSKTGSLNMNKLHQYKISDDIFLSNESTQDGDNHGLVMFIDWSGSMHGCLADTISNLLNLVEFCRKGNIPYRVFAFTSVLTNLGNVWGLDDDDPARKAHDIAESLPMCNDDDDVEVGKFRLLNFFNSDMNNRQHKAAKRQMIMMMAAYDYQFKGVDIEGTNVNYYGSCPRMMHLGATPLNECILAANDIIRDFKAANDVQICNAAFLTDGEASGGMYAKNSHYGTMTMKVGRQDFNVGRGDSQTMLKWLRASTGCNTFGFRILDTDSPRACKYEIESAMKDEWQDIDWYDREERTKEMAKKFKKDGTLMLGDAKGYDEFYLVRFTRTDGLALEDLDEDASFTKIKNSFLKGMQGTQNSRKILVRFSEVFAQGFVN